MEMSSFRDRNVIDFIFIKNNSLYMYINDDMEWKIENEQEHLLMLQDKINDYIASIQQGLIFKQYDRNEYSKIIIQVINTEFSFSKKALDFFEKIKVFVNSIESEIGDGLVVEFIWGHYANENNSSDNVFNDGFDYKNNVNIKNIYPYLMKNQTDDYISIKCFDNKYSLVFVYKDENDLLILTKNDLKKFNFNNDNELCDVAFDNLSNINFEVLETVCEGIYGVVCGGLFESLIIGLNDILEQVSNMFNDDILISAPARDLVFIVPLHEQNKVNEFLKYTKLRYEQINKENSKDIFTKDIFEYNRSEGFAKISTNYLID